MSERNSMLAAVSVYCKPRLLLVMMFGFASGLPLALTASTLTAWLTKANIDISTIGLFAAIGLPYSLKFFWSHLVDHLPIPLLNYLLGRRRAWLLITQAGLIGSILGLGYSDPNVAVMQTAMWALIVSSLSATQDIAVDAYRVELLDQDQQGAGAAMSVFGYRLGLLVSGAGALFLAQDTGSWSYTYQIMAACMGVGVIATLLGPKLDITKKQEKTPVKPVATTTSGEEEKEDLSAMYVKMYEDARKPVEHHEHLLDHPEEAEEEEASIILPIEKRAGSALIGILLALLDYLLVTYRTEAFTLLFKHLPVLKESESLLFYGFLLITGFVVLGSVITVVTGKTLKETTFSPFLEFTNRPLWLLVLLFVIFYKLGDALAGSMTTTFLIKIGFDLKEIAQIVKTFGLVATLFGAFIGGSMVKRMGIINSLWIAGFLQMISNLMFVLQANIGVDLRVLAVTIGVENLSGGMGTAAFVAYLSSLCNLRYTATQYALLSSLSSVARTMLVTMLFALDKVYFADKPFIEVVGWSQFFVISTAAAIPGLMLLWVLSARNGAPR